MSFQTIKKTLIGSLLLRIKRGTFTYRGASITTPPGFSPVAAYLLHRGRYEISEATLIENHVLAGAPVIELGGSIGVVSSVIRRVIGPDARHVIVEANADLIPSIRKNCGDANNATIIEHAAIDYSGAPTVSFSQNIDTLANRVGQDASGHHVRTIQLNQICAAHDMQDYVLVSDIEGAELAIIDNDAAALGKCSLMVMELHPTLDGVTLYDEAETLKKLEHLGFGLVERRSNVVCMRRTGS